jgi:hypothetical protein
VDDTLKQYDPELYDNLSPVQLHVATRRLVSLAKADEARAE